MVLFWLERVVIAIKRLESIMLAPKILPIAISVFLSFIAVIVVTNSGIFVPIDIIKTPKSPLLSPRASLKVSIPETKTLAPKPTAKVDIKNWMIIYPQLFSVWIKVSCVSDVFEFLRLKKINIANIISRIMESRVLICLSRDSTVKTVNENRKKIILLGKPLLFIFDGHNIKEKPKTSAKLQTIEPRAVLIAIVSIPLSPDITATEISGNVVAIATIGAPTIIDGILVFWENHMEDSTNKSPPFKIKIKASIIQITAFI